MLERPATGRSPAAGAPERQPADFDRARTLAAEGLGSGLLIFFTVAAGILGERYAIGNTALAVAITALTYAAGFAALAATLRGLAPCYFNPVFTVSLALSRSLAVTPALTIAAVQIGAALLGASLAHFVTNTGLIQTATQTHFGTPTWFGEFLGTGCAVLVFLRLRDAGFWAVPVLGGCAMLAVALATPSLSLANPAATLARGLTDSLTSIRLIDAAAIALCQLTGAFAAYLAQAWLFAPRRRG